MKRYLLAIAGSLLAGAGMTWAQAPATDLPLPEINPIMQPVSGAICNPVADSWSGFYAGINGGGGLGVGSTAESVTFTSKALGTNGLLNSSGRYEPVGWNVGGQIGYNRQISRWLIGVETDWQWTPQSETTHTSTPPASAPFFGAGANGLGYSLTEEHKLTNIATLRGRAGVVVKDSLWYVTGGGAVGTVKDSLAYSGSANPLIFPGALQPGPFLPSEANFWHTRIGWAAGAGVETRLSAHWSVKFEYLFVDLGTVNQTMGIRINPAFGAFSTGGTATATSRWLVTDNIIRIGLNYKF